MADIDAQAFVLMNEADRGRAMVAIKAAPINREQPIIVQLDQNDKDRTAKQNRLAFLWYKCMADYFGEDYQDHRARCKLMHGIPIMREKESFDTFYQQALLRLTYAQQLAAMEYVPVTRLMGVKQFSRYLNIVEMSTADRGLALPTPADIYYEALMKSIPKYRTGETR